MLKEFTNKLNNEEYISNLLYEKIKNNYPHQIPSNLNIDDYNNKILEKQYIKYKDYFDNMYKDIDENINLDQEQAKAILADEDYSLIIAGAGTGKTTTMVSKVKYLVDIKKVDPSKILVMSFTKKATQELEDRIYLDFNINANVTTFHSLGYKYIKEKHKDRKCYIADENIKNKIFYKYFKENIFKNKKLLKELIDIFDTALPNKNSFNHYFKQNYEKYETYEEYFDEYKKHIIKTTPNLEQKLKEIIEHDLNQENIYTIKGELVKSKGEAIIANFLTKNNINYKYEQIMDEIMEDRNIYKPDFTITTEQGEKVYIEYYGLSTYTEDKLNRYQKIKAKKDKYHQEHNTNYIKIDYGEKEDIIKTLIKGLIKYNIKHSPKTDEEIYEIILNKRPYKQFIGFKNIINETIEAIKSSSKRKDYQKIIIDYINTLKGKEKEQAIKQAKFIITYYQYYQNQLETTENYGYDFSDLLYYANLYLEQVGTVNHIEYEYIIIDEYQDISQERYEFTKKLAQKNNAKVVAVGDDWQSIYAFTGSKISYIYNFQNYFKAAKLLQITKTYRNSQELINATGEFIMRNEEQIKKQLISNKTEQNPIVIKLFDGEEEYNTLKKLILDIHKINPDHKILILARTNYQIDKIFKDKDLKDEIGTKIKFIGHEDIDIDGMTIHKSKGLTSDEVIVIGLDERFPSTGPNELWIKYLFITKPDQEQIEFAEERRIFYVALTRTKNHVYLLANRNPKKRSKFVDEIYRIEQQTQNMFKTDF